MLWQKIKLNFKRIIVFLQELFSKIFREATGETKKQPVSFAFFFSFLFRCHFIFYYFILVGKNPFSLLIPFSVYDLPSPDRRTTVTLYVSDGKPTH